MRRVLLVGMLVNAACGCGADPGGTAEAPISTPAAATPATTTPATGAAVTSIPATVPATSAAPPSATAEGDWRATGAVVDGANVTLDGTGAITLTIEGSRFFGTAACNHYEWVDDDPGPGVSFTGVSLTAVGCEPAVTELQDRYLGSVGPTATYTVDGDVLTWHSPTATWVFERILPAPLVGTVWVLNGVTDQFGSMSVPGIDAARIEFFEDGSAHGSTGCRPIVGEWAIDDADVVTVAASVSGDCSGPLVEIDARFVAVLDAGFEGSIDGSILSARPTGDLGVDFVATPATEDDTDHLERWHRQQPAAYSYVFTVGGMCSSDSVRVYVTGGTVTSSEPLTMGCGYLDAQQVPTIDEVFTRLADVRTTADEVRVTWDPDFGFPTHVQVDEDWQAIDDEYGFSISEFAVG